MRSEQNEGDCMLGTDINYGCGQAVYDGSDGPRERGEEELMSPPMNPNGGGGWSDTCPYGVYLTYDECLQYHGWDEEYCSCVCISSYSDCGGGEKVDLVEFFDCLGIEGSGNVGMCILGLIGVGYAAFAAAASGGALLPVVILVVIPAAWQCNVAIGEINS
ncbi:MAG: hypothetical protein R6W73_02975 [Candidatus Saliniplasma sp.]